MRLAELAHARVAVWGYGREGRAALTALCSRLGGVRVTLFCSEAEAASAVVDFSRPDVVRIVTTPPDAAALAQFDVVIKSPGISAYRTEVVEAQRAGVRFTSGTALWFAEHPQARTIAVTGTKGKSTTSAMIAHCARALGIRTALAGNIGLPLLDLNDQAADLWIVELSSFQTGEAGPVSVGVITSLYEEHLDWHGTRERYLVDKLKLADMARILVVSSCQPELLARTATHPQRLLFGNRTSWYFNDGDLFRRGTCMATSPLLSVSGAHNELNACAALAALDALGVLGAGSAALDAARALADFTGLPHRLQSLGMHGGIVYVNDSISTTPYATIEALRSLDKRDVSVLIGGFDRGIDWTVFVEYVAKHPPHAIVTMGANGGAIAQALQRIDRAGFRLEAVESLVDAVTCAKLLTPPDGTVLLSPGAPSFDQFRDYAARGREFARLAGFDPQVIAQIEGLGIA